MTQLYLINNTAPTGTPTAEQSTALPNGTGRDGSAATARQMSTTIGTGFTTVTITHDADTAHDDWLMKIFGWALPVVQDINAQTWTISTWSNESNAAANTCVNISLYVYRSGTGVIGFIVDAHQGTPTNGQYYEEPGTSFAAQAGTVSGAAVTGVQSGDLLVLEVWHHVLQGMASAYTSGFRFSGAAADHDSFIQSTQDLETVPPSIQPSTNVIVAGV